MLSFGAAKASAGKKLVILASEFGFYDPFFRPKTDDPASSALMGHLGDFSSDLTVFRGIAQPEVTGGHYNTKHVLTCNKRQSNGAMTSLDQVAAEAIHQETRYKSIHLGADAFSWNAHSRQVISDRDIGPDKIHEKLFTRTGDEKLLQRKIDSLAMFRKNAPANPAPAYLRSLKELEEEVAIDLAWNKKPIPEVEMKLGLTMRDAHDRGYINPVEQQLQLVRHALLHDRTQIALVSPPYIDKMMDRTGATKSYHGLGHNTSRGVEGSKEELLKVENFIFDEYRKFIASLKENNQLDDTIVLIIGAFSDAGRHSRPTMPTVLVGGGFNHRGIVDCLENDKLNIKQSHLYLTMLRQMGITADDFAGDTGNVDHLLM